MRSSCSRRRCSTKRSARTSCWRRRGTSRAWWPPKPAGDGVVVARLDGSAAAGGAIARVVLLAVHPGRRRLGCGSQLLGTAEAWARDAGATELQIGGPVGTGLWPGVDVRSMSAMLCLVESAGFVATGAAINLSLPATFRAEPPAGIDVRRVLEPDDVRGVRNLVDAELPAWRGAVDRSIEHGACLAAVDGPTVVASPCTRSTAPVGRDRSATAAAHRDRGIGTALLGAVAKDLMVAGLRDVQVVGAERVGLFVRAGGAVSRVFRTYAKPLR